MKCKKYIVLILIFTVLFIFTSNKSYALGEMMGKADNFLAARPQDENPINEEALQGVSNDIYNILFIIAVVIAFGIGMIIGIQFIVGSIDEKAKIKETLIPYIIGVVVIFSAFGVWKIVVNIGNDVAPIPEATGRKRWWRRSWRWTAEEMIIIKP